MKRLLLIAYHFPPVAGSSGVHRTLKFCQYLPRYGWEPFVLTVRPSAYDIVNEWQLREIPSGLQMTRTIALNARKHLSIRGRYPGFLEWPDRWSTWWLFAVPAGLAIMRRFKPDAIMSTFPMGTAHLIGATLCRLTRRPWIADFRDPMVEGEYPLDLGRRRFVQRLEERTVRRCTIALFTTPGMRDMYAERYSDLKQEHWGLVRNGYDEENFRQAEASMAVREVSRAPGRIRLLHSGLLYPEERDPLPFFEAVAKLHRKGTLRVDEHEIVLRATGYDDLYQPILEQLHIEGIVKLEPVLSYHEALREMLDCDGLLLFQGENCNRQIPVKLYEYLRAKRPVLALTDPSGDTARELTSHGVGRVVRMDAAGEIADGLEEFLRSVNAGQESVATEAVLASLRREALTGELAGLLDRIV